MVQPAAAPRLAHPAHTARPRSEFCFGYTKYQLRNRSGGGWRFRRRLRRRQHALLRPFRGPTPDSHLDRQNALHLQCHPGYADPRTPIRRGQVAGPLGTQIRYEHPPAGGQVLAGGLRHLGHCS